jgi:hypothetical protein
MKIKSFDYDIKRTTRDTNGNPRYIVWFMAFLNDEEKELSNAFEIAKKRANSIGFKKYRGKDFGGGFVGQSYNIESTAQDIINSRKKDI